MLRRLWNSTSHAQLMQAQERLLAHHSLTTIYTRKRVTLPSTHAMNSIQSKRNQEGDNGSVCLLAHGLGSGLALFYPNLEYLSQRFDRVVAIDWLGFGGSSRPNWNARPDDHDTSQSADFFVDSLREFCVQEQLSSFTFVGHSLGGLLATEYAMKFPDDVERLFLLSPAGFPSPPPGATAVNASEAPSGLRLLDKAWQSNVTPGGVVRMMGPKGLESVRSTVRRRFRNRWNERETNLFADYLYHITTAAPSGEYAMNGLLTPVRVVWWNVFLFFLFVGTRHAVHVVTTSDFIYVVLFFLSTSLQNFLAVVCVLHIM